VPKGFMYVESLPKDPAKAAEYHEWYNDVHLQEVVAAVGFVSGRRLEPADGDGPFVAIFEFDDDVDAVRDRVANARSTHDLSPSQAEVVSVRFYRELASHTGGDR
jgi:hypothetical protein